MSRVTLCTNVWNQNKLIPSQVQERCLKQTGQNHCATNKSTKKVWLQLTSTEKQVQTANEYRQQIYAYE